MATEITIPKKERWTYQDYINLTPPDNYGYQVVRGELIVSPSPKSNHQWVSDALVSLIRPFVLKHRLGWVFSAPLDVVLDADRPEPENVVQPDIIFVSNDRLSIVKEDNIQGAPDLVVEILSDSTARYDRVHKMRLYTEFGVKYYWIVDADQKTLEVFDLTGTAPVVQAVLSESDILKPVLFTDLEISLSDLWYPEADGRN